MDDYSGLCYCIERADKDGTTVDVTANFSQRWFGGWRVGGYISERDAREVMSCMVSDKIVGDCCSPLAAEGIIHGNIKLADREYRVVMKRIVDVGGSKNPYIALFSASETYIRGVYHYCGECYCEHALGHKNDIAIPYTIFRNAIKP